MSVKEQKPEGYNLGAVAGAAHERERIIQILEKERRNDGNDRTDWLIALIKGEDK